jgi:hypothetical protein
LGDSLANSNMQREPSDLIELHSFVSDFHAFLDVIARAEVRGLPGGVHGEEAEVIVDKGLHGSTITIRAGALALYTVMSFGADGGLKSVGAFEDLEPECVLCDNR